jgi:hypothetical protein
LHSLVLQNPVHPSPRTLSRNRSCSCICNVALCYFQVRLSLLFDDFISFVWFVRILVQAYTRRYLYFEQTLCWNWIVKPESPPILSWVFPNDIQSSCRFKKVIFCSTSINNVCIICVCRRVYENTFGSIGCKW